jgi:tRNA modification GTPase
LEIQGHGGTAIMQLLLQRCIELGKSDRLRLAQPGEFTLRAFLNDKIDLAQAEAIADLIDATSSAAAKAAAASLSGAFSTEVHKLADQIMALRTLVEATLDFPEEEIEFIEKYQVKEKLYTIRVQVTQVLELSRQSSYLKEGLKVVLVGEPNVGKSSLINAICGQDIAIVTDIAGTTRDRIKESLTIDGIPISITDTAGLRDTQDPIEHIGIERTWQAIGQADVVLNVMDIEHQTTPLMTWPDRSEWKDKEIINIFNKCDILENLDGFLDNFNDDYIVLSAKTGFGLDQLKQRILHLAGRQVGDVSPWLGRARHIAALEESLLHLDLAGEHVELDNQVLDLLAEELRLAHIALGEITGQVSNEDLLGHIFSTFCIGK